MGTGRHDGRSHRFGRRCHVLGAARRGGCDGFKPVANRFRDDRCVGTLRIPDPRAGHVHRVRDKDQYQPNSESGQIVFADTVQTVTFRMQKTLSTIAHVTSTGTGALVKSGTTADVYSVNAAAQQAAAALGGGGGLNSAYSAVASVPGAYVPGTRPATTRPSLSAAATTTKSDTSSTAFR